MEEIITSQCLFGQHKGVLLIDKYHSIFSKMNYTLGQRLKIAREYAGISQTELADAVGIRQSAVSRIERDEALTTGFASRLAKACGVRTDWLSEEDGDMLTHKDIKSCENIINQLSPEDRAKWFRIGNSFAEPAEYIQNGTK